MQHNELVIIQFIQHLYAQAYLLNAVALSRFWKFFYIFSPMLFLHRPVMLTPLEADSRASRLSADYRASVPQHQQSSGTAAVAMCTRGTISRRWCQRLSYQRVHYTQRTQHTRCAARLYHLLSPWRNAHLCRDKTSIAGTPPTFTYPTRSIRHRKTRRSLEQHAAVVSTSVIIISKLVLQACVMSMCVQHIMCVSLCIESDVVA